MIAGYKLVSWANFAFGLEGNNVGISYLKASPPPHSNDVRQFLKTNYILFWYLFVAYPLLGFAYSLSVRYQGCLYWERAFPRKTVCQCQSNYFALTQPRTQDLISTPHCAHRCGWPWHYSLLHNLDVNSFKKSLNIGNTCLNRIPFTSSDWLII